MTTPKPILIDPVSATSLLIEVGANGHALANATGFCVAANGTNYLMTNWHVLSGRDPDTNKPMHSSAAVPDDVAIAHHAVGQLGSWTILHEPLIGKDGKRLWLEHPRGRAVDVVALPLKELAGVQLYPLDLALADKDILVQVAMAVSIVGFPFGLAAAGAWPIWKTGHIASDPDLDYAGSPAFLIDATTRGGMSGAPVILRAYGGYTSSRASMVIGSGPATRFLGIYSGRIHDQAEIGRVWRPSVINDILGAGA